MPLHFTAAEKGITGKGLGIASESMTSFLVDITGDGVGRWFDSWAIREEISLDMS